MTMSLPQMGAPDLEAPVTGSAAASMCRIPAAVVEDPCTVVECPGDNAPPMIIDCGSGGGRGAGGLGRGSCSDRGSGDLG